MNLRTVISIILVLILFSTAASAQTTQHPLTSFITWLNDLIDGQSTAAITSSTTFAGWRASNYGYQWDSPPQYWINVANTMASKFPGSIPAGIWLVGETHGEGTNVGTDLYMPCTTDTAKKIWCDGSDKSEEYLTAFDSAGVKVILQVESAGADMNTLIDTVLNQYKHHSSVIGFGVDNEWLPSNANAATVNGWNTKVKSHNPDYILMIKHYEESALPTGIDTDILVICDDEQNGNLATLVSEHVAMESRFPNNRYGAQYGYPSDKSIWGSMSDPAKQIGNAIQSEIGRPISYFWVDFSITTVFPPSQYNTGGSTNPTPTVTPTPTGTRTPTLTVSVTPTPTPEIPPLLLPPENTEINPLFYIGIGGIVVLLIMHFIPKKIKKNNK